MKATIRLLAAALALAASPAGACPGLDSACAVEGGVYHALTPEAPRGLIVYLHGWGGVGRDALATETLARPFLDAGYALAAPQGAPRRTGDRGGAWNAMADDTRRDDVAFLRRVIADARARFGLTGAPALMTGFSGGGMMVWRLACDAPDSADAYAPVAGLLWRPLPARCAGPARLFHTHGWADDVVPLEGRAVAGGRLVQGDLFGGLAMLRRSYGCGTDKPDSREWTDGLLIRRWRCGDGAELALALHDGGHLRPAGWAERAIAWLEKALR